MKKVLLTSLLLCTLFTAIAQTSQNVARRKYYLNAKTVVKDSAGVVYSFNAWSNMMRSGEYELRPIDRNSDSTAFLIYKKASGPNGENSTIMTMKPDESTFFKTGETIPSFAARDINGNKLKLSDLKGKVVVMNFWFIGCPPCRQEIPELNKIALDYANDPDVIFIAVGLDDRWAIRDFIKDHPFGYHIIENGRTYASMYGINPYPTSVILDKQGKVVFGETSFMPSTFYWIKKTINEAKQAAL